MTETPTDDRAIRKLIAEQVRRHCTPSSEAYSNGGDALIAAVADWIENTPEWVPTSFDEPPAPVTLTPDDFVMRWDAEHTFSFVESEDATIMAYGHRDPVALAAEITEYDRLCAGPGHEREDWTTEPDDIRPSYAVLVEGGPGDEWRIQWGKTPDEPGAFPVSVVTR